MLSVAQQMALAGSISEADLSLSDGIAGEAPPLGLILLAFEPNPDPSLLA